MTCGEISGTNCDSNEFTQEFSGIGKGNEIYCSKCFFHFKSIDKRQIARLAADNKLVLNKIANKPSEFELMKAAERKANYQKWLKNNDMNAYQREYRRIRKHEAPREAIQLIR